MKLGLKKPIGIAALFVSLCGCNALLGNDEGTGNNATPNETEKSKTSDDTDDDANEADASRPDSGTGETFPHTDAKKPCTDCGAALVANIGTDPYAVQVSALHVFFADNSGIHRIAHNQPPCTTDTCADIVHAVNNYESIRIAYDEKNHQICWNDSKEFGCTDEAFKTTKVSLDAIGADTSNTGLLIRDGQAYATYDRNRYNLGRKDAIALASGQSAFGSLLYSKSGITAFAISGNYLVWSDDNDAQKPRVSARRIDSGDVMDIPGVNTTSVLFISKLRAFNGRAYFADGSTVYSAPMDGSDGFTAHAKCNNPISSLSVTSLGILVGCGDEGNYGAFSLAWGKLAPPAGGKPVSPLEPLTSAAGKIGDIAVAQDSIYFTVNPWNDEGRGVWKVVIGK